MHFEYLYVTCVWFLLFVIELKELGIKLEKEMMKKYVFMLVILKQSLTYGIYFLFICLLVYLFIYLWFCFSFLLICCSVLCFSVSFISFFI